VLSYNYNYDSIVLVVNDVVNVMAAYQPVVQACGTPCTARLHNRLICRHNIDHVINYEHNRIIIVVIAKHEIVP
jgi:hypothetical protein